VLIGKRTTRWTWPPHWALKFAISIGGAPQCRQWWGKALTRDRWSLGVPSNKLWWKKRHINDRDLWQQASSLTLRMVKYLSRLTAKALMVCFR
jgi:hypothetical protein